MKVISFNANGIRASARNGFYEWLAGQDADFVCIQETKAHIDQLIPEDTFYPNGYHCDYYSAQKKGYSGVAIYARQKPERVVKGIGFNYCDEEGRYIQFDYPQLSVISLYLPSGTSGDGRQDVKYQFLAEFAKHLLKLKEEGRELIICGDYNIAHKAIDLKNWKSNQKNSGFLPEERAWMDELFGQMGFVDAFRVHNQAEEQYTWWSYRSRAWEKNVGWRIDYQVVTPGLQEHIVDSRIFREARLSDHAPLLIEYIKEIGVFKLASWNVNSLKVRLDQVLEWMEVSQIDVLAMQETKSIDENFPAAAFTDRGYHITYSGQKTYNGVAVVSRLPLANVVTDIPNLEDPQRRILAVDVAGIRLINLYVPNGSEPSSDKFVYKLSWLEQVTAYIKQQLEEHQRVAIVGDFNIAPEDRDVHDPAEWVGCNLVSPQERLAFSTLLDLGLHDSFRSFEQEEKLFSWWDYRAAGFRRNRGMRIDHVLLNNELNSLCRQSKIDKEPRKVERPSDHAPVWVELDL